MKQKLFVLSLLLTFMVSAASAWTGYDDEWWLSNGYTGAQQDAHQSAVVTATKYEYATAEPTTISTEPLTLNTADYDNAVNAISTYLGTYGDQMPADTKAALQTIYNDYVAKEKAVMVDWHSKVYDSSTTTHGLALYYPDIKSSWDGLLAVDAAYLEAKLKTAKALTEAQMLIDKVNAMPESSFYGRNSGTNTGVWDNITVQIGKLTDAIADYDELDQDDATALGKIAEAVTLVQNALASNDEACKEADQQLLNLIEIRKQVEAVLNDGTILSAEAQTELNTIYTGVASDLTDLLIDASTLRYDKIGQTGDDFYDNQLLTETAKLTAALNKALNGSNADMFLTGLTWTYGQPLPIVEPVEAANAYELDWTDYDAAVSNLNSVSSGIDNLNATAQDIAADYTTKKTAVETEWATDAFNSANTAYTKPNQWKYNQTAWNAAIAQDAQNMISIQKAATAIADLKTAYDAYTLADTDLLGDYASQYGTAKNAVESILNMSEAEFKEFLNNADFETLSNINNVRANYIAAYNANKEEQADVKTANSYLETMIAAAQNAADNMTGTSANEQQAKTDLTTAIAAAQTVADKVNASTPAYSDFNNAKDITDAAKDLSAALTTAQNLYNSTATAVAGTQTDDYWVYTVPVYGAGTQSADAATKFALDWTEYEALRQQLADLTLTYDTDAQTAANQFGQDYSTKQGKAEEQYNNVQAWTGAGEYDKAGNWSYNQTTWQAGIDADVETMKSILVFANALEALAAQKAAADALAATDILAQYSTTISTAKTDAQSVLTKYNPLTSLEEADKDAIINATVALKELLAANAEEKEDVDAAINLLKANIQSAQALIDKNMVAAADVPTLETAITTAQAVVTPVDGGDYSALNNAADVTAAYMVLTDVINNSQTGETHAPEYSWNWTYSVPLNLGEEGTYTLDWDAYNTALANLQALQATTNDATFSDVVNKLQAGYVAKQTRANTDWTTKQAWNSASGYPQNWSYNQERWNLEIKQDAYTINQLVDLVKAGNQLYDLLNGDAKTLKESTEILGSYSQALKDAMTAAQTVYDTNVTAGVTVTTNAKGYDEPTSTKDITAIRTAELLDAYASVMAVINANTEEQMDVTSAAEVLENAINAATAAAAKVEDVDGGTQYVTAINDYLNTTPNVAKLLANAQGKNYTETDFEIADAQTILEAAKNLNAFVASQLQAYAGDITNITPTTPAEGWIYAQPLRLGDNQDPAAQDSNGDTKYTLDWTGYEKALAEMKGLAITAPEALTIRDNAVTALETRETTAKAQWTSEPAWTGTNDKFANQFQYNQTTWQSGIEQDARTIYYSTKVFAELEKMYVLNQEVEPFIASKEMLQAAYLKNALNDALKASKDLYTGLTDGTVAPSEANYAELEAAYAALQAAYDAVKEETKDVKTAQPLLNSAIAEARKVAESVEDVTAGTYKTNILNQATEAEKILKNAQDNNFNSGDDYKINYAKTLTDAIRDLNKVVRDNVAAYNTGLTDVAVTEGWVYPQPLRLGTQSDPATVDAGTGATKYTLDWNEYQNSLDQLVAVVANAKDATLKENAQKLADAFTTKKATAETQWTSKAWEGTNEYQVNQFQYNQTSWNAAIANDAKVITNVADLVVSMDSLYSALTYAKTNLIPAADNKNVVSTFAAAIQAQYDEANGIYDTYKVMADSLVTRVDVQTVDNAKNMLDVLMGINKSEIDDIDEYRPLLYESYKAAKDIQGNIEDASEMKYFDALGDAIKDAKKIFDNANNGKYNEFKNAQEVTIARRALVLAMIKQQNLYQDTISALKDTLQKTIDAAREASQVVNVHNTYSTDLQNEIAGAYAMMSADAMLKATDNQDLNIAKLQAEITRLKRVYCSAFILDLDSLKAAIADAQKFYDGITPYVSYKGVETAQTEIKTAIETAQAFLADAEAKNATQTATGDPYNPTFTTAAAFNTYNTVDVPAATDALNKEHMAKNLAALKAVADSIQNYVTKQQVVALYQNALNQVVDHANSVYGQYQPTAEEKAAFSNFETQNKITDAIVTAIGDAQKFYAANEAAIQEAEAVRAKLQTKIDDAKGVNLDDTQSQNTLKAAIDAAQALYDNGNASPEELTNGITALEDAILAAYWSDDKVKLQKAITTYSEEREKLTDEDAVEIMDLYINKAEALLSTLNMMGDYATREIQTEKGTQVVNMITELGKGLTQANTYNNGEMLPDMLAKAAPYKDLIPDEYAAALDAHNNSASLPYSAVKAKGDALAEAVAKAEAYTAAKEQLQTTIDEAKLSENPTAEQQTAIANAETAVAAAFTQDQTALTAVINAMETAYNELQTQIDADRWSHQALTGKLVVKPWKANTPVAGQAMYIKLAGKYTSADADVANNSVDLFVTNIQGTQGTRTFDWAPFSAETDYQANIINLSSVGVADYNNFNKYGWTYQEHYNDIIIKAGAIYSSGDGFVNANNAYGPFTWTNVWNQNDLDILDKDADGNYYGRYYTFKWNETNEGGVYRVPSQLGIYDETGDQFKVKGIKTYISHPTQEGDYFINADLVLDGDKGYDTEATVFNYENGTAILNGRWHRIQFIWQNQFLFHQAAQKAADWYNNNPDLRQYDTAALEELKAAVESDNNRWDFKAIEEAMEKVLNSYGKVNMIKGDSLYGVIADGAYADVERTYTVTGAPDDAIDPLIIAQTDNWTKDDTQYWEIVSYDQKIGADSTATIKVKFNPGTTYPADFREYQAILDVKIGNLNYQNTGKENLQQNLFGANPKLSLKEAELLQTHSLALHRKDSITYDLYGRGYAHLYEKSPLKAKFYSATGLELGSSEVKTSFVKNQFTAYAADNDLDQTKFTVSYYPEDLGADVVKVVISDTIRQADDIVLTVNAAKSQITFDPATVYDANQNKIQIDKKSDGTNAYFYPADGETYYFPIAIANFDGVNAYTEVVNEDGVVAITTEKMGADGLVEEHLEHKVQITMDNRNYFDVTTATTQINGTNSNVFVIAVKANKLESGTNDDGQHDGLLQVIWQDQDTINIHLNQTLPWFSAPATAGETGPIVDSVIGNIEWEFTEDGDKVWYVDVNDVDNYYSFAVNFGAYTNTDWFLVNPAINYQLTQNPGTRKYRLSITYNPHEVNTVYEDVLTLNIFDTKRNVIVATTSIKLKGDAVSSIKGGATGVNNAKVQSTQKDGKYIKDGKLIIVKDGQEFEATGAQMK